MGNLARQLHRKRFLQERLFEFVEVGQLLWEVEIYLATTALPAT